MCIFKTGELFWEQGDSECPIYSKTLASIRQFSLDLIEVMDYQGHGLIFLNISRDYGWRKISFFQSGHLPSPVTHGESIPSLFHEGSLYTENVASGTTV